MKAEQRARRSQIPRKSLTHDALRQRHENHTCHTKRAARCEMAWRSMLTAACVTSWAFSSQAGAPHHLCNAHHLCVTIVDADATAREACAADPLCTAPPPFACDPPPPALAASSCSVDDCLGVLPFSTSRQACHRWFAPITNERLQRLAAKEAAKAAALLTGNATAAAAAGVHPAIIAARAAAAAAGFRPATAAASKRPAR
jgi:hypothetical protein